MLNQVIVVGKVEGVTDKSVRLLIEGNERVPSTFLSVELSSNIADNVKEYCQKGSIIGIKAHLQSTYPTVKVIAEKVTFINSQESEGEE